MRRLALCAALILTLILAQPTQAATVPSLSVWSQNQGGNDLLVGGRVLAVVELRADAPQDVSLSVTTPAGLTIESISPSSGRVAVFDMYPPAAPPPGLLWTGTVSSTQPINIAIMYVVMAGAEPGERQLNVTGRAAGAPISATAPLRICCTPWPPPATSALHKLFLATFRH